MSSKPDRSVVERMASDCLAARVRILSRAITRRYDTALRPLGVKVSQINILVVTAKLRVARPGQICDILQMDASTLSRNAERMVAQGWLEVAPGDDPPTQPLEVTRQGMKLLERALPAWEKAQAKTLAIVGKAGATLLIESARKMSVASTRE